jgi:hypothetical protein
MQILTHTSIIGPVRMNFGTPIGQGSVLTVVGLRAPIIGVLSMYFTYGRPVGYSDLARYQP